MRSIEHVTYSEQETVKVFLEILISPIVLLNLRLAMLQQLR